MSIIQASLTRLLKPLIKTLLKNGMTFDEFSEVAKRAYVEVADRDFKLEGRKQTASRVSMLTGIQRKEVSRLRKLDSQHQVELDSAYNRGVRVTSGWRRDPDFSTRTGKARALPLDGKKSFAELVKRFSGDLPARAVLDEFVRSGVVEVSDNRVTLKNPAGYVPRDAEANQLNILGQAVADLISTIYHNMNDSSDKRLQLTVAYNNLSEHAVERFKKKSQKDGWALIKAFDEWLSKHDHDANPEKVAEPAERIRAGVGIYFFQEPYEEKSES